MRKSNLGEGRKDTDREENKKEWATATLKEVPFWREGMEPEAYDIEREYYAKNFDLVKEGTYVPLWKQKRRVE